MTTVLLIRHALTDSVGKRISGRAAGVHLNEQGREQVSMLALRLRNININAVYSSPRERATETAAPLIEGRRIEVIIRDEFDEIDFGEWTNQDLDSLNQDPLFQQFNAFRTATRIPGGELISEVQSRFAAGMETLMKEHDGETVAIVSHADPIKSVICYYAGIPLDLMQRLQVDPASVTILELHRSFVGIRLINHTGDIKI